MLITIVILGIAGFFLMMGTTFLGYKARIGKLSISVKWHYYLAGLAIIVAIVHMFLALSFFTIK